MSFKRGINKESVTHTHTHTHTHNGIVAIKENEIMPSSATRMDLDGPSGPTRMDYPTSEVIQTEKDKCCAI